MPSCVHRAQRPKAPRTLLHEDEGAGLARYLAENAPAHTFTIGFPLLMALTAVQGLSRRHVRPDGPAALAGREAGWRRQPPTALRRRHAHCP